MVTIVDGKIKIVYNQELDENWLKGRRTKSENKKEKIDISTKI